MSTESSRWPHLGDIALGLIDARLSGIDFWDTDAGQRLLARRPRKAPAPVPVPHGRRDPRTVRPR